MKNHYNLEELMQLELNPIDKRAEEARGLIKSAAQIFSDIGVRSKSKKAEKISGLLFELSEVK